MFAVVATWLLATVVIIGLGLPIACRRTSKGPTALRGALWAGLFVATTGLTAVNLVAPLRTPAVAIGITVLAALGIATSWRRLRKAQWDGIGVSRWWVWGVSVVAVAGAIGWLFAAQRAPSNYDTGLYHLGAIEYAAQASTVPGLANLFGPLGFGTFMMPLAAAFTNGPLVAEGYVAVNGFLLLLLPADVFLRLFGRSSPDVGTRILLVGTLAIYPPLLWTADAMVTSPTSETAVLIFTLIGVAELADAVWRRFCTPTSVLVVITSLTVAAAMRPQSWVMVVVAVLVLIGVQRHASTSARDFRRMLRTVLLVPAIAIVVGAVRDVWLSGWWFYPLNRFPIGVPWRAEEPTSALDRAFISPARGGYASPPVMDSAARLPDWLATLVSTWEFWILSAMLILGLVLLMSRRSKVRWNAIARTIAPGVSTILVWIVVGPTMLRFDWGPWFSTAAVLVGWGWMSFQSTDRVVLSLGGLSVAIMMLVVFIVQVPQWPAEIPDPEAEGFITRSGLVIDYPLNGSLCWDTFPMCTTRPSRGTELRGSDWTSGFWRVALREL